MIFGTDTSSYQKLGTYDPGAFEIINALDPALPAKAARNEAEGRPWGVYSWVFPGEHGSYPVGRAINAIAKTGSSPPLGVWWDYEEDGVKQVQLDQAFATADGEGLWSGYYANNWRVDHSSLLGRPFWLAAYPYPNDGEFRGLEKMSSSRPVQLWQFTSTDGKLDQNVVVDEAWFAALTGPVVAQSEEEDMPKLVASIENPDWGIFVSDGVGLHHLANPKGVEELLAKGLVTNSDPILLSADAWTSLLNYDEKPTVAVDPAVVSDAVRRELDQTRLAPR